MRRRGLLALCAALLVPLAVACGQEASAPEDEITPSFSETENVYIVSADDVILNGRLFGPANEVAVILSHMQPNDQTAWFEFAEELADAGYAALTFNFRGYGDSGGDQEFEKLDDDLAAAVRYLHDRGKRQVFLIGASMGGTTSIVVAAQADVEGVVAISAPAEFEGQNALEAVPNVTVPKLFIASEGDELAALSIEQMLEATGEPKDSEIYPGIAHGTNLFLPAQSQSSAAIRQRILAFLDEHAGP
jgi:alpha-beta hydrolase superfamily lysophospholipase